MFFSMLCRHVEWMTNPLKANDSFRMHAVNVKVFFFVRSHTKDSNGLYRKLYATSKLGQNQRKALFHSKLIIILVSWWLFVLQWVHVLFLVWFNDQVYIYFVFSLIVSLEHIGFWANTLLPFWNWNKLYWTFNLFIFFMIYIISWNYLFNEFPKKTFYR